MAPKLDNTKRMVSGHRSQLRSNLFLEALFCKLSGLALSITLGSCDKGLNFTNFISNILGKVLTNSAQ
jgi:hypothetical protein